MDHNRSLELGSDNWDFGHSNLLVVDLGKFYFITSYYHIKHAMTHNPPIPISYTMYCERLSANPFNSLASSPFTTSIPCWQLQVLQSTQTTAIVEDWPGHCAAVIWPPFIPSHLGLLVCKVNIHPKWLYDLVYNNTFLRISRGYLLQGCLKKVIWLASSDKAMTKYCDNKSTSWWWR